MLSNPVTPNAETMTLTATVATSAALSDGYALAIEPDLSNITGLNGPVPVMANHDTALSSMIGQAYGFSHDRSPDGVDLLVAEIKLEPGPDVERLWGLIESGAVKWSARFEPTELATTPAPGVQDVELVTRWRLLEISAVSIPADPLAVTRSHDSPQGGEEVEDMESRRPGGYLTRPVRDYLPNWEAPQVNQVLKAVERSWGGQADHPLWLQLREIGYGGRNGVEVLRSAMSTSDLPQALLSTGDRQLVAMFAEAPQGIRAAASVRQLGDYRGASSLDTGLVGKALPILEGGELKFSYLNEQAAQYKPTRFGLGLSFTHESIANDDLAGLDRGTSELGAACLQAEAEALADLLQGNALGAMSPDGKRLFHADHSNTVPGALSIQALGAAVALLRKQTTVGGRLINQAPGAILCSPGVELTVRQLLSPSITPNQASAVNPFLGLAIEVDPLLSDTYVYLLAAGARRPLELGRVTPSPQLANRVDFTTSAYQVKAEHSFGCVVVDHRPIVRIAVTA